MNRLIIDGKCLYTPNGAAREYAAVGCNFYRGCPYQCKYCYNRKGITAGVMGLDHAVLENCFKNMPKKYAQQGFTPEEYAVLCFTKETQQHLEYLRDMGIFFSFSTDPLLPETWQLTMDCARIAVSGDIPVKMLTKTAFLEEGHSLYGPMTEVLSGIPSKERSMYAFGFTLTGSDEDEQNACPNAQRVETMRKLHDMGFKTFASIEPIVDFDSSYRMIRQTVGFCDQYLIGLMSKRGKDYPPYVLADCEKFIQKVMKLISEKDEHCRVYWKNSIYDFVRPSRKARNAFSKYGAYCVGMNYMVQYETHVYPIHLLAGRAVSEAVSHLEALAGECHDEERVSHERYLADFLIMFYRLSDFSDYLCYLFNKDSSKLEATLRSVYAGAQRFWDVSDEIAEGDLDRPFLCKVGKGNFTLRFLHLLGYELLETMKECLKAVELLRKEAADGED